MSVGPQAVWMAPLAADLASGFRFGAPELYAVALAVVIITTWAAIRYILLPRRRRGDPPG